MQDEAVGRAVNRPVLFLNHGKPARAEPENLNVLKPVDTLQHQSFQLPQPGAKAQSHSAPGPYGDKGKCQADHRVYGKEHSGK